VSQLVAGESETRAQFDAEPTAYRWIFYRHGDDVWIRILERGLRAGIGGRTGQKSSGSGRWARVQRTSGSHAGPALDRVPVRASLAGDSRAFDVRGERLGRGIAYKAARHATEAKPRPQR
jgi:hypothetical protein